MDLKVNYDLAFKILEESINKPTREYLIRMFKNYKRSPKYGLNSLPDEVIDIIYKYKHELEIKTLCMSIKNSKKDARQIQYRIFN